MDYDDRLNHTLEAAEARFGARTHSIPIKPIVFHDGRPGLFSPTWNTMEIRLSNECKHNCLIGCYQLAHETIHLLSPVKRRWISTLEEGLAELFAREYVLEYLRLEAPYTGDIRYNQAMHLMERFLTPRRDAIRHLRRHQPVLSSITEELLRTTYPEAPASLCLLLATPFYTLSPPKDDATFTTNDDESSADYDDFYHLHPHSYLCDIIYGVEPMTRDIATMVRFLRVEHQVGCEAVAYYLSERKGHTSALDYQLGKALSEMAAEFLHERLEDWPA